MKGVAPKNHPHQVIAREREGKQLALVGGAEGAAEAELAPRSGYPRKSGEKAGVDDSVDDRETPPCVFVPLDAEFAFTIDVASSHANAKCVAHCTLDGYFLDDTHVSHEHGLILPWRSKRVWCNPPFSDLRPWVERAWDEDAEVAVLLLPNNRAEQPFWQKNIEPYRDRPGSILTTRNLPKRRPFLHMGQGIGNRTSKNPPFGLVVAIWDRRRPARR